MKHNPGMNKHCSDCCHQPIALNGKPQWVCAKCKKPTGAHYLPDTLFDIDVLKKVKKLSNGKFGKYIVITGDAQIVLQRLMEIHILVTNHLTSTKELGDDK